jgi:hypothetical protein
LNECSQPILLPSPILAFARPRSPPGLHSHPPVPLSQFATSHNKHMLLEFIHDQVGVLHFYLLDFLPPSSITIAQVHRVR